MTVLPTYVHLPCTYPSAHGGQRRASDTQKLKLQTLVSCHVGTGNRASEPLRNLSSPWEYVLFLNLAFLPDSFPHLFLSLKDLLPTKMFCPNKGQESMRPCDHERKPWNTINPFPPRSFSQASCHSMKATISGNCMLSTDVINMRTSGWGHRTPLLEKSL